MGGTMGGAEDGRKDTKKREDSIVLATRPQSFYGVLKCLIDSWENFPLK